MLQREKASIEYWLEIALMYYRKGFTANFAKILGEALREESFDDRVQKRHLFENELQRIRAMNVLAGHQLNLFEAEPEPSLRKAHSQRGFKLIEEANTMSQIDPHNLISMCFYEVAAGQLKQALGYCETCEQQIRHMQSRGQKDITGLQHLCLLARAIIDFNKGQIKESLANLKTMIKENPRSPSDIWFAMGLCYFKLGNIPKAKISLDRTIELDPENSMALSALGVVEIATNLNNFETRETACAYFERAFKTNPRNPIALKFLADHYFFKGGHSLAKDLAEAGLDVLKHKVRPERSEVATFRQDIDLLRSCFYYILGKIEHVKENYQEAFQLYEQSLKYNSNNYQAHFCMAKVHYQMRNFSAAEQNLLIILRNNQHKDSYEALRILAQIKARQSRSQNNHLEAIKLFKRVIELNPNDYDANFEMGALFEVSDPKQALIYYEAGVKSIRDQINAPKKNKFIEQWSSSFIDPEMHKQVTQSMVPPELLNNLAVLLMEVDRHEESRVLLEEALRNCNTLLKAEEDDRIKALKITTRFNLACSYDNANKFGEATEIFKQLIEEEPSYTDAYLRLAYLAKRRGDQKRSLDYIEKAKANHLHRSNFSKPTNLFCIKGQFHVAFGQIKEAVQELKQAYEMMQGGDPFARVGLANIQYASSTMCRQDVHRQEEFLRRAMNDYFKILEIDEKNCSGVLGIGNVLAEYGKVHEAKEIFKLLATSEPDSILGQHAQLNHAHLLMAEENYEFAVNSYQVCLEKQPDNLEIALYLSKAYYKKKDFAACQKLLFNLLSKHPEDIRLKYNLANCLYQQANETLNKNIRRVKETKEAIKQLTQAKSFFEHFIDLHQKSGGQEHLIFYPTSTKREVLEIMHRTYAEMFKVAEGNMSYLNSSLQNSEYWLEYDQKREDEQLQLKQERDQKLEETRRKEEEAVELAKQEAKARRDAQTEQFKLLQTNLGELDLTIPKKTSTKRERHDTGQALEDEERSFEDPVSGQDDWLAKDEELPVASEEEPSFAGFSNENSSDLKKHKERSNDKHGKKEKKAKKKDKDKKKRLRKHRDVVVDDEPKQIDQEDPDVDVGQKRKRRFRKTAEIEEDDASQVNHEIEGEANKRQKTQDD